MYSNQRRQVAQAGALGVCSVMSLGCALVLLFPGVIMMGVAFGDSTWEDEFFNSMRVVAVLLFTFGLIALIIGIILCVIMKNRASEGLSNVSLGTSGTTTTTVYSAQRGAGYAPTTYPVGAQIPPASQPYQPAPYPPQQQPYQAGQPYPTGQQYPPPTGQQYPPAAQQYPPPTGQQYPPTTGQYPPPTGSSPYAPPAGSYPPVGDSSHPSYGGVTDQVKPSAPPSDPPPPSYDAVMDHK